MRKKIEFALRILLGVGIFYLVLRKIDLKATWEILKSTNLFYFSGALMAYLAFVLFSTLRWRVLIQARGARVAFWPLLKSFLASIFLGNVLPSGAGLDAARAFFLSKATSQMAQAIASVVIDRITSFIGLLLIVLIGIPLGVKGIGSYKYLAISIAALIIGGTMLLMLEPVHRFIERLSHKIPYGDRAMKLYQAFYEYRNSPSAIVKAVLITFLSQGSLVVDAILCAKAIGHAVPFAQALIYVPTINFIMIMPVSIGGIGIREGSFVFFLSKVAHLMPEEAGFTVGVLYGISAYLVSLLGGLALLTAGRRE